MKLIKLNLNFVDLYSLTHSIPWDCKFGFTSTVEMTQCFLQNPQRTWHEKVCKGSYDFM